MKRDYEITKVYVEIGNVFLKAKQEVLDAGLLKEVSCYFCLNEYSAD